MELLSKESPSILSHNRVLLQGHVHVSMGRGYKICCTLQEPVRCYIFVKKVRGKNTAKSSKKANPQKEEKWSSMSWGLIVWCFWKQLNNFSFIYIYNKTFSWNRTRQWMQDLLSFFNASQFYLPFLFFCQKFYLLCSI